MQRLSKYRLLLILAAAIFLLDQASKVWIQQTLPYGSFFSPDNIVVIPGLFNLVHVGNTGAAWSMFSGYSWALSLVAIAVLLLIAVFRKHLELEKPRVQLAYGLIIGGIIGNLADRIRLGHVVDFLDFHYQSHHFPSFNVADSGITVGVFFYILYTFRAAKSQPPADSE